MKKARRTLSIAVLLLAWSAAAALAGGAGLPWPALTEGHAYASSQTFPTAPALPNKAPTTNGKGVTVVFYAPGSEGLAGFIDDLYSHSPGFARTWDQLLNESGMSLQLQWWHYGQTHMGAHSIYDPGRQLANVGIDPNDPSGTPYGSAILESNITRAVLLAQIDWQLYNRIVH